VEHLFDPHHTSYLPVRAEKNWLRPKTNASIGE
jgi:hypothetical protein